MTDRPRLLLVDDEPTILKMVSKRLELEGFAVLTAMDGREALAKAQAERPDLLVLDLMLPGLNGYEICATLKQDPRYRKLPIILFTARTQAKDEHQGLACGADAFVRKPFRAQELLDAIHRLLPSSAAGALLSNQGGFSS